MKIHELKCLAPFYDLVKRGIKTFEVRKDDRVFSIGDTIHLKEYDSVLYTGRGCLCEIVYKLQGGAFGIEPDYCVLGIKILQ